MAGCRSGKTRYHKSEAIKQAVWWRQHGHRRFMAAYPCRLCGHWHVGNDFWSALRRAHRG